MTVSGQRSMARRAAFLGTGLAVFLVVGLLAFFLGQKAPAREPFFGAHQAGITTGSQKFAFVAAFDLTATSAAEVRSLFQTWSRAAEALTQGLPLGPDAPGSTPAVDTGETLGYRPARLTVTFGVGASLFDGRFGLADRRPAALVAIPPYPGDHLNPQWSDGDLVVQVGADDLQTAYHALHTLTRLAKGVAVARWVQSGFQPGLEVNPQGPGRNLQGFEDGTVNPDTKDPATMDRVVWAHGPDWMKGGSYLVVRRIRMFVETWDRSSLADQERTIGRDRPTGEPLASQDETSHVKLAKGDGSQKILRRPFSYVNGLDGRTGQWDSGLLFLAWMQDPARQYLPMQARLSSHDALGEYIQPVGSALFAVFPGTAAGDYVGSGLFPAPTAQESARALQAALGALYPPLGRGDWAAVRTGADAWNHQWAEARGSAGNHGAAIEAARTGWARTLTPETPDPAAVRLALTTLLGTLGQWEASAAPARTASPTSLDGLKAALAQTTQALVRGDAPAAQKAFAGFQAQWTGHEALVRSLDTGVYSQIELQTGEVRRGLQNPETLTKAATVVATMNRALGSLSAPQAYTAWDAGILLFREGLEALLVLAALLAFLTRSQQNHRKPWVWSGAVLGIAASIAAALAVSVLMTGWSASAAPQLIEGITGLVAVVLMLVVGAWLHRKSAVKDWNQWLKAQMGSAQNRPWALGLLAFVAVLREGAETVVFFWGMAGALPAADLVAGIAGGLVVLVVLGVVMIGFSKRLPLGVFFPLATALIGFLAVKVLGQSLGSLQSSGWVSQTPLGFAGPVDWLGFSPSWETAGAQLVLAVVLVVATLRSGHGQKVPKQKA